jgi:hypothetical protein
MGITDMTKTIRLGMNRGNPRLWLEGPVLANAGFTRGARYSVLITDSGIIMELNQEGKRRVAGKSKADGSDHPIIDMNGANLLPFAGVDLTLTAFAGRIVIERREA